MVDPNDARPIRLVHDTETVLTAETLASYRSETRHVEIVCASGNRYTAAWRGVPVSDLLESIDPPTDTTHVAVESSDGHCSYLAVGDALEGLIAFYRDDEPLGEIAEYDSRFVVPGIEGKRLTKGVRELRLVSLEPGTDPSTRENLVTDGREIGAN